jgi:hypothetical protein
MPKSPLPTEIREFLALPNPAVMATVRKDGQPVTVATWYLAVEPSEARPPSDSVESSEARPPSGAVELSLLLNLDGGRARLAHLRAEPRISLTVLAGDDWYSHVSLQGRVARIVDDEDLADIDRIAVHYTGHPYRVRDRPRVSVWCTIDSWHGWGSFKTAG